MESVDSQGYVKKILNVQISILKSQTSQYSTPIYISDGPQFYVGIYFSTKFVEGTLSKQFKFFMTTENKIQNGQKINQIPAMLNSQKSYNANIHFRTSGVN